MALVHKIHNYAIKVAVLRSKIKNTHKLPKTTSNDDETWLEIGLYLLILAKPVPQATIEQYAAFSRRYETA